MVAVDDSNSVDGFATLKSSWRLVVNLATESQSDYDELVGIR